MLVLEISGKLMEQRPTSSPIVCCISGMCGYQRVLEHLSLSHSAQPTMPSIYGTELLCTCIYKSSSEWDNAQPKIFDLTVILGFIPRMRQEAEVFLPLCIQSSSWVKQTAKSLLWGALSSSELCYQSSDTLAGSRSGTPLLHMCAAVLVRSLFVSFTLTHQLRLISTISSQFEQMRQWMQTRCFRSLTVCWRSHLPLSSTNVSSFWNST